MDTRIPQLLDEATAGLQDDPELRLDIKAELRTHLDATAQALREEGMSEEESTAEALKQFGSPVEMAGELLEANRTRMQHRALVRLAIRRLLIPAAVLVALWVGYGGMVQLQQLTQELEGIFRNFQMQMGPFAQAAMHYAELPLSPKIAFYRKVPNTDPLDNPSWDMAYFNQFINMHQGDTHCFAYAISRVDSPARMEDLRKGRQLEPENALYDYLLAREYLRGSYHYDHVRQTELILVIDNRSNFDKAMQELRRGLDKPYLRDYQQDILREELARLPHSSRYTEYYQRALVSKRILTPTYACFRELCRLMPEYAEMLIQEGRTAEALSLLSQGERLPRQMLQDSHDLLGIMVAAACAKIVGGQTASIKDSLGMPVAAWQIRSELARFTTPGTPSPDPLAMNTNFIADEFQWLDGNLLGVDIADGHGAELFIPQRTMGYKLFEEFALDLLLISLGIGILAASAAQLLLLARQRHAGAVPILLVPGWKQLVRVLLLGVVVPLAAYAIYTLLPFSGRAYSVEAIFPRFVVEMLLLGGSMIVVPAVLMARMMRTRCRRLRISIPGRGMRRAERRQAQYRLYYGTIARSLVPLYALVLILAAALCKPVLAYQEHQAYLHDRLFFVHSGETMSRLEAETLTKLRRQMLGASD